MLRTFQTHRIRKQEELSSCLWDFMTLPEGEVQERNAKKRASVGAEAQEKNHEGAGPDAEALSGIRTEGTPRVKMLVPGCWESDPRTRTYRGRALYERRFCAGGNLRLEFKGVSHTAEVYLDGEKIARHYNAYTPFDAVVRNVPQGTHRLQVFVDNSFGEASALHVENDYQTYGGITRGVALERLGEAYLTRLHVTPVRTEQGWCARAEIEVSNLTDVAFPGRVRLEICPAADGGGQADFAWNAVRLGGAGESAGGAEEMPDGAEGQTQPFGGWAAVCAAEVPENGSITVSADIPCPGAAEWNPDSPILYTVSAVLENGRGTAEDDLIDRFGFRSVEVSGKDILLNGRKLRIRGFCRHEDHPQFGCALPFAAIRQDLLLMRDMGANSVRTSHYPNDELFLDLCDETGMLVWEENHARGLSEEAMRNPNFERQCEDCIREMIGAHYNHPSIYIWGILNECASHTEYGKSCYEAQLSLIRSLDQTRPRSFASCQFKTDICFGLADVISYNIYPLWYHDTPVGEYLEDLYRWVQEETEGVGKPFLITEIGAGAIYGYRTPEKVKWSEEYQAETVRKQLEAVLRHAQTSGVYIWQFCDCRVCGSWFANRPRTMNNKGIVDEYRRPKLAYETVKELFGGR